jgi:hypothetical protein
MFGILLMLYYYYYYYYYFTVIDNVWNLFSAGVEEAQRPCAPVECPR